MVFCQLCSQFVGSGFQFPSSIFVEKRPYFPCSSLLLVKDHLEDPLRATCDCECVGGYSWHAGFRELLKSLLVRPSGRLMPSPWDDPEFSSCAQSSEDELRPDYLFFSSYWLAFSTNRSAIHIVHLDAFFFSFFWRRWTCPSVLEQIPVFQTSEVLVYCGFRYSWTPNLNSPFPFLLKRSSPQHPQTLLTVSVSQASNNWISFL
jgi:hypothetical protein